MVDFTIPEECFFSDYDADTLQTVMDEQMAIVKLLKKHGKSKHMANRLLVIFDDLVGSTLFSNARGNPFKMLNTNHRHYSASLLMVSQAYKEIPKTVRTNFSCLIVFEIPSEKEIEVIFEENSLYMKRDEWMEMYEHAVEGEHDFLFINYQKPKRLRAMKNFAKVLFVERSKAETNSNHKALILQARRTVKLLGEKPKNKLSPNKLNQLNMAIEFLEENDE